MKRGGAFQEGVAHLLRGGALSLSFELTLVIILVEKRGGNPLATTWPSLSHKWCAPLLHLVHPTLLGFFTLCYKSKHPPIVKLVGVWEPCLWLYTIVILFIWNKETLEVKKVWMLDVNLCLIYEVIFA